jgi:RNA-directed DNA polymerase
MLIDLISGTTRINPDYIAYLVRSAGHRYKLYTVPKKRGGLRQIAHPARELKFLQRWIARNIMAGFPIHQSAMAYRTGSNIREVAEIHKSQNYLLLMDFESFFESITYRDICEFLVENKGGLRYKLDDSDCDLAARILTRRGVLPIGAPSSPVTSNAMMFGFDVAVSKICEDAGIYYSRYADDLQLSTSMPGQLAKLREIIDGMVGGWSRPKLRLNRGKTVFTSKKRLRMVVGLKLTSSCAVSVGRTKKRRIKSLVFRYKTKQISAEELSYLRGYVAFLRSVEPSFLERIGSKYGNDVLESLCIGS